MRKSTLEKLVDLKRKKTQALSMTIEDLMLLLLDDRGRASTERQANPTQREFIYDPHPFSLYMGPKGCAKTSTICCAGMLRAVLQPGSKGLVARRDYNDLKQTTKLRLQEMLSRLPKGILLDRSKDPPENWILQPVPSLNPDGSILDDTPTQMTFMGLDSLDEGGGYEFDWAIIDEATECEERSIHSVNGLLRNMPKSWPQGVKLYRTMLACNPPDVNHWIYSAVTGKDHTGRDICKPWMKLFLPQPNENQRNLPSDYYERLAATLPTDMRKRLVEGQWGSSFAGTPVFKQFSYPFHTFTNLRGKYNAECPLLRFWDFGFHRPYVCFAQLDHLGRLLTFHEVMGQDEEIDPFVARIKKVCAVEFPDQEVWCDYGDPAAKQKKDTGQTLARLTVAGIRLRFRASNIDPGLAAIRLWLERTIQKEPALQFDRRGCPILIRAIQGVYHYDAEPHEVRVDHRMKPEKDGYYDHPVDAFRYGLVNIFGVVESSSTPHECSTTLEYDARADAQNRSLAYSDEE